MARLFYVLCMYPVRFDLARRPIWDTCIIVFQEELEQAHLEKILGSESLEDRTSSFATEESMDLYCSFFSKV